MPITQSAKKALRQTIRRRARNKKTARLMKEAIKTARSFVHQNKHEEARTYVPQLYKLLDKAAKKGVIKKNTASRTKSRILRSINKSAAAKK